jgi:atypical dual specificity phosphatase
VLRVRAWWNFVEPQVILGARPLRQDVQTLWDAGVRGVVNTCAEYAGPVDEYQRLGIEQLHIPTIDFTPPSLEDVNRSVEFMQQIVTAGNVVYVHCKAGRARSATVVLCWLIRYRQLSPEKAQQLLLQVRPHVHPRLLQRTVVLEFIAETNRKSQRLTQGT